MKQKLIPTLASVISVSIPMAAFAETYQGLCHDYFNQRNIKVKKTEKPYINHSFKINFNNEGWIECAPISKSQEGELLWSKYYPSYRQAERVSILECGGRSFAISNDNEPYMELIFPKNSEKPLYVYSIGNNYEGKRMGLKYIQECRNNGDETYDQIDINVLPWRIEGSSITFLTGFERVIRFKKINYQF